MEGYGIGTALVLAIWAYVSIVLVLGPGLWLGEALVAGAVTGLVVGDVTVGLQIGATLTLMSLGMWTYGGATMPDFMTGAILGTAVAALKGGDGALEAGLAIAIPASILMTQLDVLGRAVTTVFIHGADRALEKGSIKGITNMHLWGQLPWGLTRAIPVFLAVWLGAGPVQALIDSMPQWFMTGMTVTGRLLPALGFALLLNQLPIKKYWPFLLIGFVMWAYLKVPVTGIAIMAAAVGSLYIALKGVRANG
ncbi:MAG TPA: PTS sugar transporter subunit IIC [Symbiobacteriaceae bacterium]|nr:PTS sugar transporter subunit IIC [Symbiobacteriaceae bacterium]